VWTGVCWRVKRAKRAKSGAEEVNEGLEEGRDGMEARREELETGKGIRGAILVAVTWLLNLGCWLWKFWSACRSYPGQKRVRASGC
jgi:hypothetical protein